MSSLSHRRKCVRFLSRPCSSVASDAAMFALRQSVPLRHDTFSFSARDTNMPYANLKAYLYEKTFISKCYSCSSIRPTIPVIQPCKVNAQTYALVQFANLWTEMYVAMLVSPSKPDNRRQPAVVVVEYSRQIHTHKLAKSAPMWRILCTVAVFGCSDDSDNYTMII